MGNKESIRLLKHKRRRNRATFIELLLETIWEWVESVVNKLQHKKEAGAEWPKNEVAVKESMSGFKEALNDGVSIGGTYNRLPKNDAEKGSYTFRFTEWKPLNDVTDKSPEQKMEEVIESIVTSPSMGDHFAYFSASPLCGSCGMAMCQEATHYEPGSSIKLRIRCLNWACLHNGILYEVVPEKSAVIVMRRVDEKKTE